MKRRDLIKKIEKMGYYLKRNDGNHAIYVKENGRSVQVPNHREINEYTAKSILKIAEIN